MGSPGSAVAETERLVPFAGYGRLDSPVPVLHAPRLADHAREVRAYLAQGSDALTNILAVGPPGIVALLVADEDWDGAPRENEHPYPPGLPYFTRSADPPALVLPERLSPVFGPRTEALLPLVVWHELAHAFLLDGEVVKTPAWLQEFLPQAASAAVARRVGVSLEEHLGPIDRDPGFTVRQFGSRANAEEQMTFQNLLLRFGAAALAEFGEDFLGRLFRAIREEDEIVGEERAEALLARSLGPGGAAWLSSRPEFQEE